MDFHKFIYDNNKKVIVTDQVSAINKVIRRMAGKAPIFGVKVLNLSQIALQIYYAYQTIFFPEQVDTYIHRGMQTMRFSLCLKDPSVTFIDDKSKNMGTAQEILNSLNLIRQNAPTKEFLESSKEKEKGLRKLWKNYEEMLFAHHEMDEVILYQRVIAILKEVQKKNEAGEFLETMVFDFHDAQIGNFFTKELSLAESEFWDLFLSILRKRSDSLEPKWQNSSVYDFYKAYGVETEVRNVILQMNQMEYGDVAILYPTIEYENVLRANLDSSGIPFTFPRGYCALGTELISLIRNLLSFVQSDFNYKELYCIFDNKILRMPNGKNAYRYFLRKGIGYGRERYLNFISSYEKNVLGSENRMEEYELFFQFLKAVIGVFDEKNSCGTMYRQLLTVVKEYTSKEDPQQRVLMEQLINYASVMDMVGVTSLQESMLYIHNYLKNLRCSSAEDAGAVCILPYGRVETIDRKHIFVLGLSGNNIEEVPMESPVLSDRELNRYVAVKPPYEIPFAKEKNKRKRDAFYTTLRLSSAKRVYISYSYFDTSKLLMNSSSVLYRELLRESGKTERDIVKVGYLLPVGDIRINPASSKIEMTSEEIEQIKERTAYFSASSLQSLLSCPMSFYYSKILKLPQMEFIERRPDQWLPPNVKGNVFHHVMQDYVNEQILSNQKDSLTEDVFERIFALEIEKTICENPTPSKDIMEMEQEEIRLSLLRYITKLHNELNNSKEQKKIIGCEVEFSNVICSKSDGYSIIFSGAIDRLDGYVDSENVLWLEIYDYKTGNYEKKLTEIEEGKQIQHHVYAIAMYAWALEHKAELEELFATKICKVRIACTEYIFPFEEEKDKIMASILWDEKQEKIVFPDSLESVLERIVFPFEQGNIEEGLRACEEMAGEQKQVAIAEKVDFCKYCSYKKICRL